MDANRAEQLTTAAVAAKDTQDPRWVERYARIIDNNGHKALGETIAVYGARYGLGSRSAYAALSAGRTRLTLRAAGVKSPAVGYERLALTAAQTTRLIALLKSGMESVNALAECLVDDPIGLLPTSTETVGSERLAPALEALVLSVESLAFHTPVNELLDGEFALVTCLEGLTRIVESLPKEQL